MWTFEKHFFIVFDKGTKTQTTDDKIISLCLQIKAWALPPTSRCAVEIAVHVAVVVVVEASAPKVYPMVTLASASTFSGSVLRTLRCGEGLPNMFCLVASSLGHLRSYSIVCGSSF